MWELGWWGVVSLCDCVIVASLLMAMIMHDIYIIVGDEMHGGDGHCQCVNHHCRHHNHYLYVHKVYQTHC